MLLVNAAICNPENPEVGWMDGWTDPGDVIH